MVTVIFIFHLNRLKGGQIRIKGRLLMDLAKLKVSPWCDVFYILKLKPTKPKYGRSLIIGVLFLF